MQDVVTRGRVHAADFRCGAVQDAIHRVLRDERLHQVQQLTHLDLAAVQPVDVTVAAEDRHGRPDGADEEVRAADAVRPEEVEPLADGGRQLLAHVVQVAVLVGVAHTADDEDGRGQRGGALSPQAHCSFGM